MLQSRCLRCCAIRFTLYLYSSLVAPVSIIQIAVHNYGKYIEVGEDISFTVTTDKGDKFNQYTFLPGDGSPGLVTEENTLTYNYSTYGNFTVEVLIWSRCRNRSLQVETKVTVEKPVQLLEGLRLSCHPTSFPSSAEFALSTDRGTDFNCIWDFGDGQTSRTSHGTGVPKVIVLHAYNTTGNYSVHLSCANRLSKVETSANAVVQVPITGLRVSLISPRRYRKAFKIEWQVQSGSHISYSAIFGGKTLQISKYNQELNGEAWVLEEDHVGLGTYDVIITASNDVTQILTATTEVLVEEVIVPFQPTVIHRNRDIEVGEVISLHMTNLNAVNNAKPSYSIDFGDGEDIVRTDEFIANYTYKRHGDFLVIINASNHVSYFYTTLLIKVHKPVILLEGLKLRSQPTLHPNAAKVSVSIKQGSDFICLANYSDGTTDEYDFQRKFLFDPKRNPDKIGLINLNFMIEHSFKNEGVYWLHFQCINRLSEVKSSLEIIVQLPVKGLYIISPPPQAFGNAVNISWQIESGTHASFEVIFKGHRFRQRMNGTYASILIGREVYKDEGLHDFSVVVWNLVTSPVSKTGQAIVEVPIDGLGAEGMHGSRDIEVNETVVIKASVVAGSNPEYVFDFGDNSEVTVTKSPNVRHRFNPHSLYNVTVTARNNVSRKTVDFTITVHKPVIILKGFAIDAKPTNWSEASAMYLSVTEGSDFHCDWLFGDGRGQSYSYSHLNFYKDGKDASRTPFTDLIFQIYHTYKHVGIFHPSIVCHNRLSSIETSGRVVVQKPISGFQLEDVSPKPTENMFTVYWNFTSGTNVSHDVDFANGRVMSVKTYPGGGYANVTSAFPGRHVFRVTVRNLVTPLHIRSKSILVEVPLANLSLMVRYESRDLEVDQEAYFNTELTAGTDPSFLFNFGDESEAASQLGREAHHYSFHSSYSQGIAYRTYKAKVLAFNNVSTLNASALVKVHKPVIHLQDLVLLTSPANVSVPTRIIVQFAQGSDVICAYDFGDGNTTVVDFQETVFLGEATTPLRLFQNLSLEVEYTYANASIYNLLVECRNRHGQAYGKTEVVVQKYVSGLLIPNVPTVLFNESFEVEWTIRNGTDVTYEVFIGNVTFPQFITTSNGGKVLFTPGIYRTDGFHTITITATNLVSSLSGQIQVDIEIPVSTVAIEVSFEDLITDEIHNGYGLLKDHFPAFRDVIFSAKADKGTHLVYSWNISDVGEIITREPALHYIFQEIGNHSISVVAKNDLSSSNSSVNITVLYALDRLQFWSNSPQMMNKVMLFRFSAANFGTEPCFSFDTGTNYSYHHGYPWCSEVFGTDNFTIITQLEDTVEYEHVYSELGQYSVTLNISNRVSFTSFQTVVDVTLAPCNDPHIIIKNLGATPFLATRVYRSSIFIVKTGVTTNCVRTNKVRFEWELYVLNKTANQFHTAVADNADISFISRELFLPKRSFSYGLYKVNFTAKMVLREPEPKFQSTTFGYLEVIPSPLVAKISGGNLIRRGFGKKVNVDGSGSTDPDILIGDHGK